ncbi:hypothetical protein Holit_02852 [Hollandina sp. SP2]
MTSEKPRHQSEEHEATQELDAYGVWVKSEPQTISESMPDISNTLNFQDEPGAPDEVASASQTSSNISLESMEPECSMGIQDFIHIEIQENEPSIADRSIPEVSRNDRAGDLIASDEELFAELSEPILMEDVLADPIPQLDLEAPQNWDAGFSEKEAPPWGVLDTPVKPPEPPHEGHPASFMETFDSSGGLQVLRNILEELSLIRHEVSTLKALILRREKAAETLEPAKEDRAEDHDEKITITGDELTNIFHNTAHIPKAVTRTQTAPFVQGIEGICTDEEPPETGYGTFTDFKESGQPQNTGTAYDGVSHTQEILEEDAKDTRSDEVPGNGVKDPEEHEVPPHGSPNEDGRDKEVSPDGQLPANSADPVSEDFLLDGLFIEYGSIKDIPIALDAEDEDELDDAFSMIESLIGPEDTEALNKPENPDDGEPQDDAPPGDGIDRGSVFGGSGGGYPDLQEEGQEPSAFSIREHKPFNLKEELKNVLLFMDQLLEALPEDKIGEFAESRYFDIYKKLFSELGIA